MTAKSSWYQITFLSIYAAANWEATERKISSLEGDQRHTKLCSLVEMLFIPKLKLTKSASPFNYLAIHTANSPCIQQFSSNNINRYTIL